MDRRLRVRLVVCGEIFFLRLLQVLTILLNHVTMYYLN